MCGGKRRAQISASSRFILYSTVDGRKKAQKAQKNTETEILVGTSKNFQEPDKSMNSIFHLERRVSRHGATDATLRGKSRLMALRSLRRGVKFRSLQFLEVPFAKWPQRGAKRRLFFCAFLRPFSCRSQSFLWRFSKLKGGSENQKLHRDHREGTEFREDKTTLLLFP